MSERGLLLAIALVFSFFFVQNAYLCDDAFFSFRTADNFVRGHGLRWNVDERVQVYSNPLHVLAFSGLYWIGHERSPLPDPNRCNRRHRDPAGVGVDGGGVL